jgi:hypothetical protein
VCTCAHAGECEFVRLQARVCACVHVNVEAYTSDQRMMSVSSARDNWPCCVQAVAWLCTQCSEQATRRRHTGARVAGVSPPKSPSRARGAAPALTCPRPLRLPECVPHWVAALEAKVLRLLSPHPGAAQAEARAARAGAGRIVRKPIALQAVRRERAKGARGPGGGAKARVFCNCGAGRHDRHTPPASQTAGLWAKVERCASRAPAAPVDIWVLPHDVIVAHALEPARGPGQWVAARARAG